MNTAVYSTGDSITFFCIVSVNKNLRIREQTSIIKYKQ